jgi:hypothetical protein
MLIAARSLAREISGPGSKADRRFAAPVRLE